MSASTIQILGAVVTVYGLGAAFSVLLQARQLLRRGTSEDVSLPFLASYVGGYALWLVYGFAIGSLPIIVVDAVGLAAGSATLAVAFRLRRSPSRDDDRRPSHRGERVRAAGLRQALRAGRELVPQPHGAPSIAACVA